MIDFPGKNLVSKKISIKYLSYTKGISATQIRNKKFNKAALLKEISPDEADKAISPQDFDISNGEFSFY